MRVITDRLGRYIARSEGCWEWRGARLKGSHPYGLIKIAGKMLKAHRVVWEQAHGPIPCGLQVLHKCDNPPCCRVDHLFLGSDLDNMRDKIAKGRQGDCRPKNAAKGERVAGAKLTRPQVDEIRARAPDETYKGLARDFGVSKSLIKQIVAFKVWR